MDSVTVKYTVTVENSVDSVEINVETEDPNASVDNINGIKQLSVGENHFEFTVTAENGSQKTDTLIITRLEAVSNTTSNDATLKSLSVTGHEFSVPFDPNTYEYELFLPDSVSSISINAVPNQASATFRINGDTTNIADSSIITITVIAPNRTTTLKYKITVKRAGSDDDNNSDDDDDDPVISGISKVSASTVQVYFDGQALHIHSPVAERIFVYSITGILLRSFDKRASDSAVSPTNSPTKRLLIIKGSSGWAKKTVISSL
jgi:hypothetical protein